MKRIKKDPIPGKNATRREIAAFWDKHSAADYWDDLRPVKVRFAKSLSEGITIRFDNKTLESLRKVAAKKGLGPTTLARMWLIEKLSQFSSR